MLARTLLLIQSLLLVTLLTSCKESGVQGGKVDNFFQGVSGIEVLSPTSVRLTWVKDSKYLSYKIYQKGQSIELGSSSFSEYVVSDLLPDSEYDFSVSGVAAEGSGSEDFQQKFLRIKTFAKFTGLQVTGMTVASANRVNLSWPVNGYGVTYDMQFRRSTDTDWTSFKTVTSLPTTTSYDEPITGLLGGTAYCFQLVANYKDDSSEPAQVDQPANCLTTSTDLTNLPAIYVGASSPGVYPWFNSIGGDPSYNIEIFDESDESIPFASLNAGVGVFRAASPLQPGSTDLYAVVKDMGTGVQARVEVNYFGGDNIASRNFYDSGSKGPVYPPLINNGKGVQNLGAQMVSGDFNCDGLKDVAVGAPVASPVTNEDLIYSTGAVVIYYGYDPPFDNVTATDPPPYLNTAGTPAVDSVYPSPHLIHYPLGTNAQLGAKLTVGNFNGDCFYRDAVSPANGLCATLFETHKASPSELENVRSCDDLAIGGYERSETLFAVYGDPLQGLVSGAGGSNFGIDEFTCDAGSSSCRSVKLTSSASDTFEFAKAISTGDFNNDGYDDLVVTSDYLTGSVQNSRVYVLRGTNQGLTPIGHSTSFATIDTVSGGVFAAYSAGDEFGFSTAAVYNSRTCEAANISFHYRDVGPSVNTGYDFTKCDDLAIGAPLMASGRGSIFTCKGQLPAKGSLDDERISSWSCLEHYPKDINDEADPAAYGSSLLGVKNQNGYPTAATEIYDGQPPDVTGALFVGAPERTVGGLEHAGSVYAYYITPDQDNHNTGGIQQIFGNASGEHVVNAINTVACDDKNTVCEKQKIINSPAQGDSYFGAKISFIEDIDGSKGLPYIAIAAPSRDVADSAGSTTIFNSGVVYLYSPDISTLGVESGGQVNNTQRGSNLPSCTDNCTWYSGGLSPFGPIVVYPQDLTNNSFFGTGGSVGGDFNADGFGDLLSSAPYLGDPIENNGGLFGFHSNDGSFSPIENAVDFSVNLNISNELNYRFENAKIIGDVNGDGYDDVISKIEVGTRVSSILYYGSTNGLISTAAPSYTPVGLNPRILLNTSDEIMGKSFYKVGSVNCDAFDDILLLGSRGSYIYYGSSTGLIAGAQPAPTPVGKNPLLFGRYGTTQDTVPTPYTRLVAFESEGQYDNSNQGVGFGDFNGDQCNDIAMGVQSTTDFSGVSAGQKANLNFGTTEPYYNSANSGRVVVLYGGAAGLQIGDSQGYLQVSKPGNLVGNVTVGSPCNAGVCKPQLLSSPGSTIAGYNENSVDFGFDVVGIKSFGSSNNENFDELAISSPSEDGLNGSVYIFQGSVNGIDPVYHQQLVPDLDSGGADTTDFDEGRFGSQLAYVGDINGDNFSDMAVSAPAGNNDKGHTYIFYGGSVGGIFAFVGESSLKSADFWVTGQSPLGVNEVFASTSDKKPQILSPINVFNTDYYGQGVSSAGDFNKDGFADLLVNIPLGDYLQEVSLPDSGFVNVYFGSDLGLQIDKEESTAPKCIYGTQPIECAPYQMYLPERLTKERSYISGQAFGDVNGDGTIDIIMGARGRNHPSGQATATGVFYIMY